MQPFKKMILSLAFIEDFPLPTLESGAYSSISQPLPDTGCALTINTNCWIDTATNGMISTGDTAYTDVGGTTPIVGGSQYFKMSLVSSYVVLIDDFGVVSVHTICAE
jgi:hypothetical protein